MLRALLVLVTAVGGWQDGSARTAVDETPSYATVRAQLEAARANGTLPRAHARLRHTIGARASLRLFADGYAALLTYDRGRAGRLLRQSFETLASAYPAAALATNETDGGSHHDCIEWATRGLAVDADRADVWIQVELRTLRGVCFFQATRHEAHRADIDEALRIATESRHERGQALALRALGSALNNAGDPKGALPKLEEAVAIDTRRGDNLALALDLMALSYPHGAVHPFETKLPLLDRAIALAAGVRDIFVEGRAYGIRGASNIILGRHNAAMRDLLTADAKMRAVGATRHRGVQAGNLSLLYTELGDYDRAEEQARLAMTMYRRAGHRGSERLTLSGLGTIALRRGDLAAALAAQQEVVAVSRDLNDTLYLRQALLRLGLTHTARREWLEAESALRESVTLSEQAGQPPPLADALGGLGALLRVTGRIDDAAAAYERALGLASGHDTAATLQVTLNHGLALVRAAQGRTDEAMTHFRTAIDRIEHVREGAERAELQMTYFADKRAPYTDAIRTLLDADGRQPSRTFRQDAFMLAERAKARTLLDAIAAGPDANVPASVADVAASLDPFELLVEFVLGAEESFAFTLSRAGELGVHRLPPRAAIERLVTAFRAHVSRRPAARMSLDAESALRAAGQALFAATLAAPLSDAPGARRLILVGDGLLFYAPFEALVRPGRESYLGDQYEIVRAPSAAVLATLRARPQATPAARFVGFGDPIVGGTASSDDVEIVRALERSGFSFAPLPGSRREVTAVAGLFGSANARVYLGKLFTASAALQELQRPNRIVHFATHAILDESVPGRSGIVVSQPRSAGKPTILRAHDLASLKIPVDLITLSGCQTGLGRVVDGEGVTGLSWALTRAGAASLMVTLWNVSDAASATSMVAFYRALRDGQTKAAAMMTARRTLLRGSNPTLRHPYYWAGYALIGDPR